MEPGTIQLLVACIGSAASGVFAKEIVSGLKSWKQGAEKRKRSDIDRLTEEKEQAEARTLTAEADRDDALRVRDEALTALDVESSLRRRLAEGLSVQRRYAIDELGARSEDMPPWPI